MHMTLDTKLKLALSVLIEHCEQELLKNGQLTRDQEQKLRRLIWQIRQVLCED